MPRYSKWQFRNPHSKDIYIEDLHPLVVDILVSRGIDTKSRILKFIYTDLNSIHSPKLLPDMEKAADRFYKAISDNEKIMIYGDYDADGITASAIMSLFLKKIGVKAESYINDRTSEGYGISSDGIQHAISEGIQLIITVDNGITAFEEITRANNAGIDVIITDHHETKEHIPNALAVVNPKRKDSKYPFSEIAGCLVAFKLCDYVNEKYSLGVDMEPLFELVAIGSIADVMPVIDENRVYIKRGLEQLKENPLPGLKALINISKINENKVDTYTVGFILAPRLNAMGRLYNAKSAYELLISENYNEAMQMAKTLDEANRERQKLDREILKKANQMALDKIEKGYNIIILSDESWHEGVIGIVASKITEKFHKPSILFVKGNTMSKGSGRSIKGFNLYDALTSCSRHIEKFGGHSMAAGLTIENEKLDAFEDCMNSLAGTINEGLKEKVLYIDKIIPLDIIDDNLYNSIRLLAPFGTGNTKPVFASMGVSLMSEPRIVGEKHVKFKFDSSGHIIEGILFNGKELLNGINNKFVDICYSIHENNYMGRHSIELNIVDIRNAKIE